MRQETGDRRRNQDTGDRRRERGDRKWSLEAEDVRKETRDERRETGNGGWEMRDDGQETGDRR